MSAFKKPLFAVLVLMATLFAAATPSLAILVRPILVELRSSGGGASGQIEVVNDRNRPMAVEIKVNRMSLPEQGQPVLTADDGKDFLIFPTIAQLPPGGRQVFRIRYIGNPAIAESQLFMFSSSELPVSEDPAERNAQIQVLYSINSVVAVTPPRARPDLGIVAISRADGPKGEKGVRVLFENKGAAHGFVGGMMLDLRSDGWRKNLDPAQTSQAFGLGLVPANSRRSLFVALPDLPASGTIGGDLKSAPAA